MYNFVKSRTRSYQLFQGVYTVEPVTMKQCAHATAITYGAHRVQLAITYGTYSVQLAITYGTHRVQPALFTVLKNYL